MSRAPIALLAALLATGTARAQYFWGGIFDSNFANDGNWWNPIAPPPDVQGNDLVFDTIALAGGFFLLSNVGANHYVNVGFITFGDGLGSGWSFTLTDGGLGGSFSFIDGGGIINNGVGTQQVVAVNLVGTGDRLFLVAAAGNLWLQRNVDLSHTGGVQLVVNGANVTRIEGVVSGAGGTVLKQDAGSLILMGANTYTGGTQLAAGTLFVGHDSALGTGVLLVTGDSSLGAAFAAVSVSNEIFLDAELTILGADNLALNGTISGRRCPRDGL
jgi:autotransporter-associated beta strand protein